MLTGMWGSAFENIARRFFASVGIVFALTPLCHEGTTTICVIFCFVPHLLLRLHVLLFKLQLCVFTPPVGEETLHAGLPLGASAGKNLPATQAKIPLETAAAC